jgi:small subunit ribosomal protein S20
MPHTKSAKKSLRKTEKRKARNKEAKKAVKIQVKDFLRVVKDGTPEQRQAELIKVSRKLDKAGAKRVIHPNKAARTKSRLAAKVATAAKVPAPGVPKA